MSDLPPAGRVLWDTAMARRAVWRHEFGVGRGECPPRDIALPDLRVHHPALVGWRVLGPIHRCGHDAYYGESWSWPLRPGQCAACKLATQARSARVTRQRKRRLQRAGRLHDVLQQLVGQLRAEPAPVRTPPAQHEHQCSPRSDCRLRSRPARADRDAWLVAQQRVATFFRCWSCDCFFPLWLAPDERDYRQRLCHRCQPLSELEFKYNPWPLVLGIRRLQLIDAVQRRTKEEQ